MRSVALDDWAWTLWSYRELMDAERLDGLVREHEQLRGAFLNAAGFHSPKSLNDEQHDFMERAGLTKDREEALQQAHATLDALRKAQAAKRALRGD